MSKYGILAITLMLFMSALVAPSMGEITIYGVSKSDVKGQIGTPGFSVAGVPLPLTLTDAISINNGSMGFDFDIYYNKTAGKKAAVKHVSFLKTGVPDRELATVTINNSDENPALTQPANSNPSGGNVSAYVLMGRKWTQLNPRVRMSLKNDALWSATGMTIQSSLGAITAAGNTWDRGTNQDLFLDAGANTTSTANWKYDGINNMAFTPYASGCTALAATGVWYKTQGIPAGEMYKIVESDMTFNSNLKWTTTGETGKLDFQSVVLHELGHTIGLGDLYNKAAFAKDTRQVMHYYTGVKRTLGNGDATGVWKLYG